VIAVVVAVGGLVLAGVVLSGPAREARARAAAQEAADRVLPGVVRVLSARGLGAAGGYEVHGALSDDPDALVSIGLPGGARCPAGSRCEAAIAPAVARARADAAELRVLLAAFDACGLPPAGVRDLQRIDAVGGAAAGESRTARLSVTVVVSGDAEADGGAALLARLDRCAERHARDRAALPRTDPAGAVGVRVDVVAAGAATPERRDGEPTALALVRAADALAPDVRHRTSVRATAAGLIEPATREFGPVPTPEAQKALAAAVERAAVDHLAATGTAAANPPSLHARLVYLPGTTSRVRAYATFRAPSTAAPAGGDDRAVVVDVDVDGRDPVALRVLTLARPWPQRFEPGPR
jgi:hypothetical protein